MKVGMLTFHAALNYGAALQAYALQSYINEEICYCEIIDFMPNNIGFDRSSPLRRVLRYGKHALLNVIKLIKPDKKAKFSRFQRKNYILSSRTYFGDKDMFSDPPEYDVVISGSDQILNTTLSGVSESYYLKPWPDSVKRVSYASSFGRDNVSDDEKRLIREELKKFSAISCREKSGAAIIENEIGCSPSVVVDPVFLLDKELWLQKVSKIKEKDSYVLVYAMEYSESMYEIVNSYINRGVRVLLLCGSPSARRLPGLIIDNAGPDEFISYIANADLVITNSFHGTAFSLIFEKKFICIAHSTRNARLENIMDLIECKQKIVTSDNLNDIDKNVVCGKKQISKIKPHILTAQKYLKNNLTDKGE